MRQIGAVAGHHRGQHHGVVLREAQRRGQPASPQAAPAAASVDACCHPLTRHAKKRRANGPAARRDRCHRCRRSDSLVQQIIRAAPDAGIVIGLRRQQPNHGAHAFAARNACTLALGQTGPAHRQPHAAATSACASLSSSTTSTLATRRSTRCDGSRRGSSTFCSSSVRTGPASTTVPSTVRVRPSESAASSGAARAAAPSLRTMRPAAATKRQRQPDDPLRAQGRHAHTRQQAPTRASTITGLTPDRLATQSPPQTATPHETTERQSSRPRAARGWGLPSQWHRARIGQKPMNLASSLSGIGTCAVIRKCGALGR
jgi:hypothetical protein